MRSLLSRVLPLGFLAVLLPCAPASAQVLRGVVVNEGTGHPVSHARLDLLAADSSVVASATASAAGWFRLVAPTGGRWLLRATHAAYEATGLVEVTLERAETVNVVVELSGGAIVLDPLIVRVRSRDALNGFYRRADAGAPGRFIRREEIEQRPGAPPSELLRRVPGLRLERGYSAGFVRSVLTMRGMLGGACVPTVYLDGMRMPLDGDLDIDDVIDGELIEGIEIYASDVTIPPELQVPLSMCGVIALWSRPEARRRLTWRRQLLLGAFFTGLILLLLH